MKGLWSSLRLDMERCPIVTLVGGGGKTSAMYALAYEARQAGKRVVVTTTTHIMPHPGLPLTGGEGLSDLLDRYGAATVGVMTGRKLSGGLPAADCLSCADLVLVEGDGARLHPLKTPADHEPVIPPESGAVIAVAGLDALGQPIGTVCHRPERVCALLGREMDHLITPMDVARILSHPLGGRKNVGPEMAFRCLLNKADDEARRRQGEETAALLEREGIPCAITYFTEEERGGLCWF